MHSDLKMKMLEVLKKVSTAKNPIDNLWVIGSNPIPPTITGGSSAVEQQNGNAHFDLKCNTEGT